MAVVRAFRALRPTPSRAAEVASPPYDVINTEEARALVADQPLSFLRVVRAEVDFPAGVDPYSTEVYAKGKANLQQWTQDGLLIQDTQPCLYIYQQRMGEHRQTGIVAVVSCVEYDEDKIRKHEYTRPDKEADRVRHIESLDAQTGPVWLTYRAVESIDALLKDWSQTEPTSRFEAADGIEHAFWVLDDPEKVSTLEAHFAQQVPLIYIADGHHRSAAASIVARKRREDQQADATDPSQFFLGVLFPHDQLQILPYNRFVHDLNGLTKDAFLSRLAEAFEVTAQDAFVAPTGTRQFGMFLDGSWHRLTAREGTFDPTDPVGRLDVSILQNNLLTPILDIDDPRTSKRIDFVGGIRGHQELERLVAQRPGSVAFACFATTVNQLLEVADANQVMPPKSTWFEPKLRSGLFVHLLETN